MKLPDIRLIISFFIFLSIFYCCVQKGTPFSFTTPEEEEVSLVIPPGFEEQRTASPWKKLDKDLKNYFQHTFAMPIIPRKLWNCIST